MRRAALGLAVLASACGNSKEAPKPAQVTVAASTTTEAPTTTINVIPSTTLIVEPEPTTVVTSPPESLREQATTVAVAPAAPARTSSGTGACGGSLPPCYVMMRESRGDPTVWNSSGSGASGKWQFMPSTWNYYGGYSDAAYAPESVQDDKARIVWDGGRGCSHWDAC